MDTSKLMALMAAKKQAMKKSEKTVKVGDGKNRIRLLPGWRPGEEHVWFHDFGQHFIKDESDTIQAVYLCTHATFERKCPVCEALAHATRAAGDDTVAETLEKAKASRTVLVNALMLDSKEPNTPVILELKSTVFSQIVDIVEENGPLVFAENGNEIIINREGKGLNTKYTAQISLKTYTMPAASLTKLNNLDDYVKQESEEQQRRAIGAVNSVAGLAAPGTAAGDVPATSPSRLAAPSGAAKSTTVAEDVDLTASIGIESSAPVDPVLTDDIDALLAGLPE